MLKLIFISICVFFSCVSYSQVKKDSVSTDTIPMLSLKDLKTITNTLQYLPAKDWLKIVNLIEQVYLARLEEYKKKKK